MQALLQSPGLFTLFWVAEPRNNIQTSEQWHLFWRFQAVPGDGVSIYHSGGISEATHTHVGGFWGPSVHSFTLVNFWAAQYRGTSPAVGWERGPNLNLRSGLVFLGKSFLSGSLSLNGEPQSLRYSVVRVWATWRLKSWIKSLLYLLASYWTLGRLLEPWCPHL